MRQPGRAVVRHRKAGMLFGRQLGEGGVEVRRAVEAFRLPVLAEQAGLLQHVLVVIENDRVDIERHRILLAVRPLRRLPVGGTEVARLDAGRSQFVRRKRAQYAARDAERHSQFMIGHHVGALAHRGRGLHLGVERNAPFERCRVDVDLALVLLVELVQHRLHADAVAAAEEIPPHDGFRCVRRPDGQRRAGEGRVQELCGSSRLPPKNCLAASALQAVGSMRPGSLARGW